ncbi:MAG TPA: glycosyltransferase 87 family protein [Gaiellaceae bacterium]|nr:glycosyltransferase 87 family protein [Gaiellaceae bacterium]
MDDKRRSDREVALAAFVAVAVFVGTWTALHYGFYTHAQIIDTPVYQRYGNEIAHGKVPYRDFGLEYPPGALPMFALPGLVSHGGHDQDVRPGFRRTFETLMWMCGAITLIALALTLRVIGGALWEPLLFAALAPLALGTVILSRFDLWPAALAAAALAAVVSKRFRLGHVLLGLATAAKFYPGVLIPLSVAYTWKRHGRREALVCVAVTVGVFALVVLPFVALAPHGVWQSLEVQLERPLQVESLGAAFLLVAHNVFGFALAGETSHGSQNVAGGAAHAIAVVSSIVQAAVLLWIWWAFARGPATPAAFVRASAAAVCAFVAFGKVLSPQFLIWLIPIVPLVRGRRGLWASVLLLAALVLTQIWFPFRYFRLALDFEPGLSWVLLARDLALVALVLLLLPHRWRRADVSAAA